MSALSISIVDEYAYRLFVNHERGIYEIIKYDINRRCAVYDAVTVTNHSDIIGPQKGIVKEILSPSKSRNGEVLVISLFNGQTIYASLEQLAN